MTSVASHAVLMDGVYRRQRHIYDLTRKYYLLGRDRLVEGLAVPPRGTVLELGCGTGRNLVQIACRYPTARLFGLDISEQMLVTARRKLAYEARSRRISLAAGDATSFDATSIFGEAAFDRIVISYSLSMIPGWERSVDAALKALNPTGSLHIVDFGDQAGLPEWFRRGLRAWLAKFHVEPRNDLQSTLAAQARTDGRRLVFTPLYRSYSWLSVIGPRVEN